LTADQVDAAARGRIWTGEEALGVGLIDQLGGLSTAVRLVKEALDLSPEDGILLQEMPRPPTPIERLLAAIGEGGEGLMSVFVSLLGMDRLFAGAIEDRFGPLARDLELMRPPVGRLQMPPFRLRL
ncbi:MAG: S49 family peptidase, partial [Methyloligellaceae bacterium]